MAETERRRRRLRHPTGQDRDPAAPLGSTDSPPARRGGDDRDDDRGLRGLVGSGTSQVGRGAALRARDASRPSDQDLADAEAQLVIIRRNWVPREELPRSPR